MYYDVISIVEHVSRTVSVVLSKKGHKHITPYLPKKAFSEKSTQI